MPSSEFFTLLQKNYAVFRLKGDANCHCSTTVLNWFTNQTMLDKDIDYIALEMSSINSIDSTFIGTLIQISRLENISDFLLLSPTNIVIESLASLGLQNFFNIKESTSILEKNSDWQSYEDKSANSSLLASHIYQSHKNICQEEPNNQNKFSNLLNLLEQEIK